MGKGSGKSRNTDYRGHRQIKDTGNIEDTRVTGDTGDRGDTGYT